MRKLLHFYKYISSKHYSTISGTLVYFLLMSTAPMLLWLTLLFGNLGVINNLPKVIFSAVDPLISYLKQNAQTVASGAGFLLIITSLYSSTNFFYHLRRSGEIIFNSTFKKGGLKLRLASLGLVFAIIAFIWLIAISSVFGANVLSAVLSMLMSDVISYVFIVICALILAIMLNLFACPYKVKLSQIITGSILTVILWLIVSVGFSVYLQFASTGKLYGKIAFIFLFLLWCYAMINCLIIGIIYNEMQIKTQ